MVESQHPALARLPGKAMHAWLQDSLEHPVSVQQAELVVGLIIALTFVKFSAPDLALTQLSVEVDNASARRLYERLGFDERYRYVYREAKVLRVDGAGR